MFNPQQKVEVMARCYAKLSESQAPTPESIDSFLRSISLPRLEQLVCDGLNHRIIER